MPAYHQMGHHSKNLLLDPNLTRLQGAFLSPVNADQAEVVDIIRKARESRPDLEMIFDPQLYFPQSNRGQLKTWSHFPSDVDTADIGSWAWWSGTSAAVARVVQEVRPQAVCSPAVVPRTFTSNDYYSTMVDVGDDLASRIPDSSVLQTVLIGIDDIAVRYRAEEVASIVSRAVNKRVFLVVCTEVEPRRELADVEGLKGVMRLIRFLEDGGQRVTVGFSSSDIALWKAAGATSCASGKFFNLRRFTKSRFEEPSGGGGQLPYWIEEGALAFLRASDVARVRNAGHFSDATNRNPWTAPILELIDDGNPWLAESWRQYLWWFADFEARADRTSVRAALRHAESVWTALDDAEVLMEEPRNDGSWIRQWRRAVAEFAAA